MSNQFLKLRRSAVPGKIPDTGSLALGEIALNTYDGLAFMKKDGINGEEIIVIGNSSGSFSGSFSGEFTGSLLGTASYAVTSSNIEGGAASYIALWSTNTSLTSSFLNQTGSTIKGIYQGVTKGLDLDFGLGSYILGNPGTGNSTQLQVFDTAGVINVYTPNYTYFDEKVGIRIVPTNPGVAVSGSLEVTGPGTSKFMNTNVQITGSLTVSDTITAQTLVVQTVTSSVIYSSGSNIFGNKLTDEQEFTGSVTITGSLDVYGPSTFNGVVTANNLTGSLYGTSSWATTASFALSGNGSFSGSFSGSIDNIDGQTNYIAKFDSPNTVDSSVIYQSASFIAINETNFTSGDPEALYVFQTHPTSFNVITGKGNSNNYLQLNIQNTNQGVNASSDVVATANNGTETTNYIDMGINGENFSGPIGEANDAYLYSAGNHLHIGNITPGQPVGFFAGGDDVEQHIKLRLWPDQPHQMSGSLELTGSLNVKSGITGSLFGTSSWAVSASRALSGNGGFSGSFTGSFFGNGAGLTNISASAVVGLNLSLIGSGSVTASTDPAYGFRVNSNTQISGSTRITGSLGVTGSVSITGSIGSVFAANVDTMVFTGSIYQSGSTIITGSLGVSGGITATLFGTSSWAISSSVAVLAPAYTTTASFNNFTGSYNIDSSSFSGSISLLSQSFLSTSASYASASGSLSTRVTTLEQASASFAQDSGSNSIRLTDLETTASILTTASASFAIVSASYSAASESLSIRTTDLESTASVLTLASASLAQDSGSNSIRLTNLESTSSILTSASASLALDSGSNSVRLTELETTASVLTLASASFALVSASYSELSQSFMSGSFTGSFTGYLYGTSSWAENAVTASTADNFFVRQDITASNALIYGTLTAQTIYAQYVTASTELITGSTQFGTQLTNTHQFTGSVTITGSLSLNNDPVVTQAPYNQFSQSIQYRATELEATASVLTSASASLAIDSGSNSIRLTELESTASVLTTASSSFALVSSSYSAFSQSYNTASFSGSFTGNLIGTSSWAVSASYALTASHVNPLVQDIQITGSLNLSGSQIFVGTSTSTGTQIVTGSLVTSGSNTLIGNTYLTGSVNITGSTVQIGNNTLLGNTLLSGSIIISGSENPSTPSVQIFGDTQHTGVVRFNPIARNIDNSISASYIYVSGSTQDLYFTQNNKGYANTTRLRWLEGNLYTGLLNGGLITTQSSTVYQISSGSGIIVNLNASLNDNPYPTIQYLNWPNLSASIAPLTASYQQAFVGIDNTENIYQQGTPFSNGQFDTLINIGIVLFQNQSTINGIKTQPSTAYGFEQNQNIFNRAFGPLKLSGYTLAASGSSTGSLIVGSGTAYAPGSNYAIDPNEPSYTVDNGTNVSKIFRYHQSGSTWVYNTNAGAGFATIDPTQYSNNGVLTAVPGTGTNREWSIQRVFWFPNSVAKAIVVYYGNATYLTEVDAIANISFESFVEAPNTAANAVYLGAIVVRNNADFTDSTSYKIQPGGLFRQVGGSGGGGSVVTQTLSGLSDVAISGPTDLQPLAYSTTAGKWINTSTLNASITGNAATATSASHAVTSSYALQSLTSSFSTTASFAQQALTASYALTATSASHALNSDSAISASYSLTASFSQQAVTASYALQAVSASYVTGSIFFDGNVALSSSYALTASHTLNVPVTASYALTASYVENAQSASYVLQAVSSSFATSASLAQTALYVENAQTASFVLNAISASHAATASSADNFLVRQNITASNALINGTITAQTLVVQTVTSSVVYSSGSNKFGNDLSNTQQFTGSVTITGSLSLNDSPVITDTIFNPYSSSVSTRLVTLENASASFASDSGSNSIRLTNVETTASVLTNASASFALVSASYSQFSQSYNTGSFTGSFIGDLIGTASWANNATTASYTLNAISASFAATASSVNTLNQNVLITGSLTIGSSSLGSNENTLVIGPAPAGGSGEGGQILLQAPGGTYTSASMWDNYQNQTRLLRGTNEGSDAMIASFNMHSKQVQFPAYNSSVAFSGTAVANLSVDSNGNVITTAVGSSLTGGSTNYIARWASSTTLTTGSLYDNGTDVGVGNQSPSYKLDVSGDIRSTGAIYANANNQMYFRGGDDAELWDINVANTIGVYGQQDATVGSIKLGSGGGIISGKSSRIGIGTINPTLGILEVNGNVYATSFTGSLFGTASYAETASYTLNAVTASYALTASNILGGAQYYVPFFNTNTTVSSSFLHQSGSLFTTKYAGSDIGLYLNFGANAYTFGDQTYSFNIVGSSNTISTFNSNVGGDEGIVLNFGIREFSLGDPFLNSGGTSLIVDDNNSAIKTTYGGSDLGLFLDYANVKYRLGADDDRGFVADGNYVFTMGDPNLQGNYGTTLVVDDNIGFIKTKFNGSDQGLFLDFGNNQYKLGDINNSCLIDINSFVTTIQGGNQGLQFILDDSNTIIKTVGLSGDAGLFLDFANNKYQLGNLTSPLSGSVTVQNTRVDISRDTYITGSLTVSGITNVEQPNVVSYDVATGQLYYQTTGSSGMPASASYAATASAATNFNISNTLTFNGTLTDYATVASSVVGSNNLFTQSTGSYTSAFFKYTVTNAGDARTGEMMAVWNGANVQYTDNSTLDIGSTSPVTCSVSLVGTDVLFNVQTNTSGWRIKSIGTFM